MCDRLEVRRVHAERVATEVVELSALGDWPYELLIRPTMGIDAFLANRKEPVTVGLAAFPLPAVVRLVDLFPEPLLWRTDPPLIERFEHALAPAALVVGVAEPACEHWPLTASL